MKLRMAIAVSAVVAGSLLVPATAGGVSTGSISGIVRADGVPVAGTYVTILAIVDAGAFGKGPSDVASTTTDATGHYTVSGLAPSGQNPYWVCFGTSFFSVYNAQCWDQAEPWYGYPSGAGFIAAAPGSKRVSLNAGQNRTGIDGDLHKNMAFGGGAVAGYVSQGGLLPLHTVRVDATQNGVTVGATYTATNGRYLITGLPAGSYKLCFDGSQATGGLSTKHYTSTCRAALVTVKNAVTTTGVNATLGAKLN